MKQEAVWYEVSAAALFLAGLLLTPSASYALSAGGIGGRPATPDPALPYSDSWFIYNLGPGEQASDAIIVSNQSEEAVLVKLYAVDSTHTADGNFTLEQEDTPRDGVGSWVTLSTSTIPLAAGAEQAVPFTIAIPEGVDVGEHSGGIIVQKTLDTLADVGAGGASILTRVGVRIYETVPGAISRDLSISSFFVREGSSETQGPYYEAVLVLKNNSNVTVSAKTVFVISGWGKTQYFPRLAENKGLFVDDLFDFFKGREDTQEWQLLRDQEVTTRVEIPRPRFGVFSITAAVTYDGTDGPRMLLSDPVRIVVIPWLEAGILGFVLLVLVLSIVGSRLRLGSRSWRTYTVVKGDQLLDLAHRAGAKWKKVMRVNRLRVPHITPGQKILLPLSFFAGHGTVVKDTVGSKKNAGMAEVRVSSVGVRKKVTKSMPKQKGSEQGGSQSNPPEANI